MYQTCEEAYEGELPAIHPDVVELAFKRSLGYLQYHLMLGDRHPGTRAGALSNCWQYSFQENQVRKEECRTQTV